jgi:hypothetical protein
MLELKVEILQKTTISEQEIINLTDMINTVYENSEREFWPTDGRYSRTNYNEVSEFITKNEMIVVKNNNKIVGSVHVYHLDKNILGFGMLTCSLENRKQGIGNLLLKSIEGFAIVNKYNAIQLELLKPEEFKHPEKEFLEKWYSNWGYTLKESIPYQNLYFKQVSMLKFPCKFDIFQKLL